GWRSSGSWRRRCSSGRRTARNSKPPRIGWRSTPGSEDSGGASPRSLHQSKLVLTSRSTAKGKHKMFVAYLVPKHDSHLVFEDGLGYIASGATEAEALAALRAQFDESMPCDDAEQIAE